MTIDKMEDNYQYSSDSDEGGNEEHSRLLAAIAKLDKRKRVLPSVRREPSLQVSEFHLSKEGDTEANTVHLRDLAKSLSQRASHAGIARKLKAVQRKVKTLPKPLEKPEANKIKRAVGFESVKQQLTEWDPIVFKQRVEENVVFPLKSGKDVGMTPAPADFLAQQGATELERKMAEILNDSPSVQKEREGEEEFPLSLEEMIQRRKELARMRAQESYRAAKAKRQSKIKSKKYHQVARRERIRQQLKEFETLQQKDPEAALQRLEEIEKERALERMSLRHKSTGKWARNQAVRAKYDTESRQVLAEQLRLSKDLTKKVQVESESSDDEAELEPVSQGQTDNPWVSQQKSEAEIDDFISCYRKYWDAQNKQQGNNATNIQTSTNKELDEEDNNKTHVEEIPEIEIDVNTEKKKKKLLASAVVSYTEISQDDLQKGAQTKSKKMQGESISLAPIKKTPSPKKIGKKRPRKISETLFTPSGKWTVETCEEPEVIEELSGNANLDIHDIEDIEDLFDDVNDTMQKRAQEKISKLKKEINSENSKQKPSKKKAAKGAANDNLLELKKQRLQIDVDEELNENDGNDDINENKNLEDIIKLASTDTSAPLDGSSKPVTTGTELDPNKFITAGPKKLQTGLPDEVTGGHEALDDSDCEDDAMAKHLTISEAFADDDVVADFSKEKEGIIEEGKPKDINLSLPGWGDWAGHKIEQSQRKRRRFMVKMPEAPPRRDENKGNLIINENGEKSAKEHKVHDIPFPFSSVKDFEASIRAPISNTFIPESAHRKFIKPAVRTKMGTIIEPMNKEVLLKRKETLRKRK